MNERTFEATLEALVGAAFMRTASTDARRRRLLAYTRVVVETLLAHAEVGLLTERELTLVLVSGGLYVTKRAKRGIGKVIASTTESNGIGSNVGSAVEGTGVRPEGAGVHERETNEK